VASTSSIELLAAYHSNAEFREKLDRMAYDHVRRLFNPEYDEGDLRFKMSNAYQSDFQDFCDGEHYVTYDKVFDSFFKIVNAETVEDYQGLRQILRRTLNCLFRTEQREDDYRSWYADLVSRFEAYLKKIYWMKEGTKMPLNAEGHEPALRETVSYFPRIEALYNTHNEKFAMFRQAYREVYNWRNRENHSAYEIESERLADSLHGAVALYLFAAMVNAERILS
jgi:type I restriction enzyme R subunit